MMLATAEFIRHFLLRVLPKGFRRIQRYGLLGSVCRKANITRVRQLLTIPSAAGPAEHPDPRPLCPYHRGLMIIIESFQPSTAKPSNSLKPLHGDRCSSSRDFLMPAGVQKSSRERTGTIFRPITPTTRPSPTACNTAR